MSKITIIGATGHLGGATIQYLLDRGVSSSNIVAVVRDEEKAVKLKEQGIEIRKGDYDEPRFSADVFKNTEKLLFVSSPSFDDAQRMKQHTTVIKAAKDAGVKHIIYTGLAYPEKNNSNLKNVHLGTEFAIKASEIPYTFLRNAFYMDYFVTETEIERAIQNGKLLSVVNGGKLNLVARKDLALAAAVVLSTEGHEGKTYELTYPEPYAYEDIAKMISKVSGKSIVYEDVDMEQMKEYLLQCGLTPEQMQFDTSMLQPIFANGWGNETSDALVKLIGYEKLTTVEDTIKQFVSRS